MKTVKILSPDVVPIPLIGEHKQILHSEPQGIRAWKLAECISKEFDVTLFIPDVYFPKIEYVDFTKFNFKIKSFSLKAALWNWSKELDDNLKDADFVIVQSNSGIGLINCSVLPKTTNVILDGFISAFSDQSCKLSGSSRIYKEVYWNRFQSQHYDVVQRSNCMLYAINRQYYNYEGQFFSSKKLGWKAFQFSPLLKVPYGIDREDPCKFNKSKRLRIVWFGLVYPYHDIETIIANAHKFENMEIDFVNIVDSRNKTIFNDYFKRYIKDIRSNPIFKIKTFDGDKRNLYTNYDVGMVLAKDWLEEKYSVRCHALDMLSLGLPVLINKGNSLFKELDINQNAIYPISSETIVEDLNDIALLNANSITVSSKTRDYIQKNYSWDVVTAPLIDYIKRF